MRTPPHILVFGRDSTLVETRTLILRQARYCVHPANTFADLDRWDAVERLDLAVLCHSLSAEEREDAINWTRTQYPEASTLVLSAGPAGFAITGADQTFDTTEGPDKLVRAVERLLDRRQAVH